MSFDVVVDVQNANFAQMAKALQSCLSLMPRIPHESKREFIITQNIKFNDDKNLFSLSIKGFFCFDLFLFFFVYVPQFNQML